MRVFFIALLSAGMGAYISAGIQSWIDEKKAEGEKMRYVIYRTARGYVISKPCGKFTSYVQRIYKGVTTYTLDQLYAKRYTTKAGAEKALQKIMEG